MSKHVHRPMHDPNDEPLSEPRTLPTEAEVLRAMEQAQASVNHDLDLGDLAAVAAGLFADRPTVAQVKAEALREAASAEEARCTGDWNGTVCDTCRASATRLRRRAARIESEG